MASMFHVVNVWWMFMTYKKLLAAVKNSTLVWICSFIPYNLDVYHEPNSDSESSDSSIELDQYFD
jgi:hypothetical protein